MGEAGDRIDDEQDPVAAVAKIFGDARRRLWREAAHRGALVAGRDDRDGAGAVVGQRVVEELAHLAPALADERRSPPCRNPASREHREQGRLADAGAGEDSDPLAGAKRREEVDDPYAGS